MPLRLAELAVRFGCELQGDPDALVERVGTLQDATAGSLAFLSNPRYRRYLAATRATAVVLDATAAAGCPVAALVARNPYATYARIAQLLYPARSFRPGRHPSAVVEAGAAVDPSAWIGAQAFVANGAVVGPGVFVGPGSIVLEGANVGPDSQLVARVTLCEGVRIGRRCLLHPGVVVGADGFGQAPEAGQYVKVPQVGSVAIGDDVEIGANTTIDRGAIGDTLIGDGVKIDNQVQIGHNVHRRAHRHRRLRGHLGQHDHRPALHDRRHGGRRGPPRDLRRRGPDRAHDGEQFDPSAGRLLERAVGGRGAALPAQRGAIPEARRARAPRAPARGRGGGTGRG
jgi:UDP-3-O-[3-hydroxymyristoyl] glucosamine N-acyltransferase